MRRAQCYFFVSTPLRMRWLDAGSVGWARRHGPVAAFYYRASSHCVVLAQAASATWRFAGNYVRTRTALAALLGWDAGTVVRPVHRALPVHYMMC